MFTDHIKNVEDWVAQILTDYVAPCGRFRGDELLESSDRVTITKEGEKHTLAISKVLKVEEGVVNVKATNELGQMSASARLRITGKSNGDRCSLLEMWCYQFAN